MNRNRVIGCAALIVWIGLFAWFDMFGADGRCLAGVVLAILVLIIVFTVIKEQPK